MVVMYIAKIPNRNSPPAFLLRESFRDGGKVKNRTLANLSHLPLHVIELIKKSLKGERLVSADDFEKVESWHHGHVDVVLRAMKRLCFERLLDAKPSRERDLVTAMVVGRIVEPDNELSSKLANTRWWDMTTLPAILEIGAADENELYSAMDWLLDRQERIEKDLAKRHLTEDGMILYDLSSSYFEGVTCPLAKLGCNRDGKKGKLQVNYGLLTDERGCPISVSVFPGNTLDHETLLSQSEKARSDFGIKGMVLVGDRGMITEKLIVDELHGLEGVDWITALKSGAIRSLIKEGEIQLGLFDDRNLFELTTSTYPGERLVACRNVELMKLRNHKRRSLLNATSEKLEEARATIERGKLRGVEKITKRLQRIVATYKMSNHFTFKVEEEAFEIELKDKSEAEKAGLNSALKELDNVRLSIKRGRLHGEKNIGKRIGKILVKYNLTHHVTAAIQEDGFEVQIKDGVSAGEAALLKILDTVEKVQKQVTCGRYGGKDAIGVRIGRVINKYKVAKHFVLDIREDGFDFHIDEKKVAEEAALDGIYVIRTSLSDNRMSAEETVRNYKNLSQVERAFRSLKTVDLKVRPIRHHLEKRVRAHIFLCMLAYYVEWHIREAWRPLLFADEEQEAKKHRDPVAPAKRSEAALQKIHSKQLVDGTAAQSFHTLLKSMSQIVRNECRTPDADPQGPTFTIVTTPTPKQQRAYQLLETIKL
jgi:transposase